MSQDLQDRIDMLERANRGWKIVTSLCVGVIAFLVILYLQKGIIQVATDETSADRELDAMQRARQAEERELRARMQLTQAGQQARQLSEQARRAFQEAARQREEAEKAANNADPFKRNDRALEEGVRKADPLPRDVGPFGGALDQAPDEAAGKQRPPHQEVPAKDKKAR